MKNQSDLSLIVFAIYLAGLGIAFLIFPNPVITLFGFEPTTEPWIRIMGYILVALAYYYIQAVRTGTNAFYQWTVHARLPILPIFAGLVLTGIAPPVLLVFGTFDTGCALWTAWALRLDKAANEPGISLVTNSVDQ